MTQQAAGLAQLKVRDYMSATVTTLSPDDRLLDADLVIRRTGVRHLPVVRDGHLVGILTERDVRRYAPSILDSTPDQYNEIFENTSIARVMTKNVKSIGPDAPLADAANLLYSERLGCLPVLDGEKVVGILTRTDLLRFAHSVLNGTQR